MISKISRAGSTSVSRSSPSISASSCGSPVEPPDRLTSTVIGVAGGAGLGQHRDRPAHDPAVDLADQVVALGHGEERPGRDQLAGRVDHPQQQLVLAGPARGEVDDRLRVEHEAVLVERVADLVGPGQAPADPAVGRRAVGDRVPVAAGVLGLVHGQVGLHEHRVRREAPVLGEQRDAQARGDAPRVARPGEHRLAADGVEHARGDGLRLGAAALGQQHGELVPAQARQHVGVAQPPAQGVRDVHDQLVADAVPERVVDRLEVVEVEHDRGAARAVALDLGDVALQLALERAAVEQPGERVVVGQMAQLLLMAPPLGDVLHLAEEVQRRAVRAPHHAALQRRPDRRAVGVQVALLGLVDVDLAGDEPRHRVRVGVGVGAVGHRAHARALELVAGPAHERGERVVDAHEAAVDAGDRHADRRALERRAEAHLGRLQRGLRVHPLGDVAHGRVRLGDGAVRVAQHAHAHLGPHPRPVGAREPHGGGEPVGAGRDLRQRGGPPVQVLRVRELARAAAQQRLGLAARAARGRRARGR